MPAPRTTQKRGSGRTGLGWAGLGWAGLGWGERANAAGSGRVRALLFAPQASLLSAEPIGTTCLPAHLHHAPKDACPWLPSPLGLHACRALVAVGTLAVEHSKVRSLAKELGFLSLADSLKASGGGKVAEAAAEVADKLRL